MKNILGPNYLLLLILFLFLLLHNNVKAQPAASYQNEELSMVFKTEFMWNANVKIAKMINVGDSKNGTRRMIPIIGGTFKGPRINGVVLSGGEDWQLTRPDGDTELNARYLLMTDDSVVIQIINRALIHIPKDGENRIPYIKSVLDFEAPENSKYNYLNHAVFIGTLKIPQLKPGEDPYVIIGVYKLL